MEKEVKPGQQDSFSITHRERQRMDFLVIEADADDRNSMRTALSHLGYAKVCIATDHAVGLAKLSERNFTHIIFSAVETNMPVLEFAKKAFEYDDELVAIPSSANPSVDDVFELLRLGARGYVLKPFSSDSLDSAILLATKGDPISDVVLNARDRNEAFSALISANLDKTATAIRQSKTIATAGSDLGMLKANLRGVMRLSQTFAKNGEEALLERMVDFMIQLSHGPASKLGRLRKQLRQKRSLVPIQNESSTNSSAGEEISSGE